MRSTGVCLVAEPANSSDCHTCSRECLIRVDVHAMVNCSDSADAECIWCGSCVDGCSQDAIHYSLSGCQ